MSLKNVITGALLFFVAASMVYMVAGESPRRQASPPELADQSTPDPAPIQSPPATSA